MYVHHQALLGFDESIDAFCAWERANYQDSKKYQYNHAGSCVNANHNILSLYGDRLPYNLCRNLEWQVLQAHGKATISTARALVTSRGFAQIDNHTYIECPRAMPERSDASCCTHTAQVCAARGLLPGQGNQLIRFAFAPSDLALFGEKTLWRCGGWRPWNVEGGCDVGYATDDMCADA